MNRKTSALTSLGISIALIAAVIYFLLYLYGSSWELAPGRRFWLHGWHMGHGIGIIVLIFCVTLIGAIILLILGAVSNRSRR